MDSSSSGTYLCFHAFRENKHSPLSLLIFYANYVILLQTSLIKDTITPLSIVDAIVYCNMKPSPEYGTN